MSGDKLNPPMTQIGADGENSVVSAQSPAPGDETLVAGFERLVQRVAYLEQLFQTFQTAVSDQTGDSHSTGWSSADPVERRPLSEDVGARSPRHPDRIGEASAPVSPQPTPNVVPSASDMSSPALSSADRQTGRQDEVILLAWRSAPLPLRLKFVRELLPADHPLQPVLKEAFSFEELRRNGRELETWLTSYPSLFADAVERLERQPNCAGTTAETLATETLGEARQAFAIAIEAMGIEWILPTAGATIGEEHEVVGEEEASSVSTGRVVALRRRGFRKHGSLLLLAQVTRALPTRAREEEIGTGEWRQPGGQAPGEKEETIPTADDHRKIPNTEHQTPISNIDPWPDWLRAFQQRSMGCELPLVKQLLAVLRELTQMVSQYASGARSEADLLARLEPLLPLLGARHVPSLLALPGGWGEVVGEARDGLLAWLNSVLNIVPISPAAGDPCDSGTMQVTGTRRTAHAHEEGTVAKVERIGLRHGERVLFRAQVLRYEMGASYE